MICPCGYDIKSGKWGKRKGTKYLYWECKGCGRYLEKFLKDGELEIKKIRRGLF